MQWNTYNSGRASRLTARVRNPKPPKISGSPRIADLNSTAYKTDPPKISGSGISDTGG
jgi:hypothetical protein